MNESSRPKCLSRAVLLGALLVLLPAGASPGSSEGPAGCAALVAAQAPAATTLSPQQLQALKENAAAAAKYFAAAGEATRAATVQNQLNGLEARAEVHK